MTKLQIAYINIAKLKQKIMELEEELANDRR